MNMIKRSILLLTVVAVLLSVASCNNNTGENPQGTLPGTTQTATDQTTQITLDVNKTINAKYQDFCTYLKEDNYNKAKENYEYIVGKNKNGKYDEVITLMNSLLMEEYSVLGKSMLSSQITQDVADKLSGFKSFSQYTGNIIKQITDQTIQNYINGELAYEDAMNYLNHTKLIAPDYKERDDYLANLPLINTSKQVYEQALEQAGNNQLIEAINTLKTIAQDQYFYSLAQEKANELTQVILAGYIEEIEKLITSYDYNKAVIKADEYLAVFPNNNTLTELKEASQKSLSELYEYTGPMYHIFFHSLIAYKEKAFDGDYKAQGYNYWMTTTGECQRILEQLYERGYVLYDIRSLITTNPDGTVTKNKIMVPKGKKPIILSIDDVSYNEYMEGDGFAKRLVIDENGKIANYTIAPDGSEVISREHDVMPMVDKFIEEHPDFSYQGARGVLALTGYEGVLGYRTNNPDEKDKDEIEKLTAQAKEVADALKANGWLFACHSYTHADTYSDGIFELSFLKKDTERWKEEVTPIIGETNIYITPFGYQLRPGTESYNYLISEGFNILCAVGGMPYVSYGTKAVNMDRQNLDGFMMNYNKNLVKDLIDPDYTIDKDRPAFPKNPW